MVDDPEHVRMAAFEPFTSLEQQYQRTMRQLASNPGQFADSEVVKQNQPVLHAISERMITEIAERDYEHAFAFVLNDAGNASFNEERDAGTKRGEKWDMDTWTLYVDGKSTEWWYAMEKDGTLWAIQENFQRQYHTLAAAQVSMINAYDMANPLEWGIDREAFGKARIAERERGQEFAQSIGG